MLAVGRDSVGALLLFVITISSGRPEVGAKAITERSSGVELSARNQLKGTVKGVKSGSVMAEVTVSVEAGMVTAAITDASRERMNLKDGDEVTVVIKSTEVMIAK